MTDLTYTVFLLWFFFFSILKKTMSLCEMFCPLSQESLKYKCAFWYNYQQVLYVAVVVVEGQAGLLWMELTVRAGRTGCVPRSRSLIPGELRRKFCWRTARASRRAMRKWGLLKSDGQVVCTDLDPGRAGRAEFCSLQKHGYTRTAQTPMALTWFQIVESELLWRRIEGDCSFPKWPELQI